jgi:hypothetical protein
MFGDDASGDGSVDVRVDDGGRDSGAGGLGYGAELFVGELYDFDLQL